MVSKPALSLLRRELRKVAPGIKITEEEIEVLARSEVLKREVIEGENASLAAKKLKKMARKATRKSASTKTSPSVSPADSIDPTE